MEESEGRKLDVMKEPSMKSPISLIEGEETTNKSKASCVDPLVNEPKRIKLEHSGPEAGIQIEQPGPQTGSQLEQPAPGASLDVKLEQSGPDAGSKIEQPGPQTGSELEQPAPGASLGFRVKMSVQQLTLLRIQAEQEARRQSKNVLRRSGLRLPPGTNRAATEVEQDRAPTEVEQVPSVSEGTEVEVPLDTSRRGKRRKTGEKSKSSKRHREVESAGASGGGHLEESEQCRVAVASPKRSARGERKSQHRESVLGSEVGGPSWSAFMSMKVKADQESIDQLSTDVVIKTEADLSMKALQYHIQLAARCERFLEESASLKEKAELWEKRWAEKDQELEAVVVTHSAELDVEKRKIAELEAVVERLQVENAMERSARESDKTIAEAAREADKAKAEACLAKVMEELERSGHVLRMEAARAFMKSRTFLECLVKESMKDQTRGLEVTVGQLKKKGLLAKDFDPDEIELYLDANGEVPPASGLVDNRVLEEDEFFLLFEFDLTLEAEKDSFLEEIGRIKDMSASEMREAGLTLPSGGSVNSDVLDRGGTSASGTNGNEEKEAFDASTPSQDE
jgi:hypothetical protein